MERLRQSDTDNVARIGLMFLDGDLLGNVLKDKFSLDYDDVDYNYEQFTSLKIVLLKIEKINPDLSLIAVLWERRPDNDRLVVPIIVGSQMPGEGGGICEAGAEMLQSFDTGERTVKKRDGFASYYYPVRDSDSDIAGVLELIVGRPYRVDI